MNTVVIKTQTHGTCSNSCNTFWTHGHVKYQVCYCLEHLVCIHKLYKYSKLLNTSVCSQCYAHDVKIWNMVVVCRLQARDFCKFTRQSYLFPLFYCMNCNTSILLFKTKWMCHTHTFKLYCTRKIDYIVFTFQAKQIKKGFSNYRWWNIVCKEPRRNWWIHCFPWQGLTNQMAKNK